MKKIPNFESEEKEREFWSDSDSTDNIDWSKAERVTLANLRPSSKKISIRLPQAMLEELKVLANKMDVPYQSLIKLFLAERIVEERKGGAA